MHKTKSYQSTFVDAEEGELIKYLDNGNMQIFFEFKWFFLTNVAFDKQQGLIIVQ